MPQLHRLPAARSGAQRRVRFLRALAWLIPAILPLGVCGCRTPGPAATQQPLAAATPGAASSAQPLPSPAPVVAGAKAVAPSGARRSLPQSEMSLSSAQSHAEQPLLPGQPGAVQPVQHLELDGTAHPPHVALPRQAWTGYPGDGYTVPGYAGPLYQGPYAVPAPPMAGAAPPWAPPGRLRPWPQDEYIFDGGDELLAVEVDPDWTVRGIDQEDTVVHYDSLKGETYVKPSNRVCIYAPRFAAVRQVYGVALHEQHQGPQGTDRSTRLVSQDLRLPATTVIQPIQPMRQGGLKVAGVLLERQKGVEVQNVQSLILTQDRLAPFDDLLFVRYGVVDQAEKPRLAESIDAALDWAGAQAAQVVVDEKPVAIELGIETAGTLVEYGREGAPCVRICKLASRKSALPGEIVDFTIRFDNIGNDLAGNVTIIDSLSARLEYVPDTAQSSLPANFLTQVNEGESLVLRWEILEPMRAGQGGVIRFRCRVR